MSYIKGIFWVGVVVSLWLSSNFGALLADERKLTPTPIFRYPVVEDATISSYFDHNSASQEITFYDGRRSGPESGFTFSCPALNALAPGAGEAWVGCVTGATDEANCPNAQELWYDNHTGTDFEYALHWHTGSTCELTRFEQLTPPVQAPAAGVVDLVEEGHPFNGNFVRLYHDLNEDGNYYNDGLRSYYLHFADNGIVVDEGDLVQAGDLLGYGGMTGLTWTPHLHFEVQLRTAEGWQPVDPFGWTGASEADPWVAPNHPLWLGEAQIEVP